MKSHALIGVEFRLALFVAVFVASVPGSAWAAPGIGLPLTAPSAITVGSPTAVRVMARIGDPAVIPASVVVHRLTTTGQVASVLGNLNDQGTNGDTAAGDGLYSGTFLFQESSPSLIHLRVSAAFRGLLQRVHSQSVSLAVTSLGVPNTLAPLDSSKFVEDPATGRLVLCNRVIVDVIEGTPYDEVAAIAAGVGAVVVGRIPELDTYQFDFPGICDTVFISNVAKSLTRDPRVSLATPAFSVGEVLAVSPPSDTYFGLQWHLETIRARDAWESSKGAINPKIGVIDTGIKVSHEDLTGKVVYGGNFYGEGAFVGTNDDDAGHGTMVSGAAAASTDNNSTGVAGVSWHADLVPLKVTTESASRNFHRYENCVRGAVAGQTRTTFTSSDYVRLAIVSAIRDGARILNMSYGTPGGTSASEREAQLGASSYTRAFDYANRRNVLIVAAAGNDSCGFRTTDSPASHPIALPVAATDRSDARATFSNWGAWVGMSAPGVGIWTTSIKDVKYEAVDGTSFAAPIVAGAANVVWARNPSWTATQVQLALRLSGRPNVNQSHLQPIGWGRLDLANAVNAKLVFCDGQCSGSRGDEVDSAGWSATGFWHRRTNPEAIKISSDIYPRLVSTAGNGLPQAFHGSKVWWYGEASTGTFVGSDFGTIPQRDKNGGTSVRPNSGDLVTPTIDLTGMRAAGLSFQTWWEIESVDPNAFDLMGEKIGIVVSNDTASNYQPVGQLNPTIDTNGRDDQPFTSGGFSNDDAQTRPPIWVPVFIDLTSYVGQRIKIKFTFDTRDQLFNGFRGWLIDDVSVIGIP